MGTFTQKVNIMRIKREYSEDVVVGKKHYFLGFLTIFIILASLFVFFGFGTIGATEVGLKKNRITQKVDTKIYHTGFHFIDPFNGFIKYPTTVQEVTFFQDTGEVGTASGPLNSRTQDGLNVHIQLAFHFRVKPENIYDIYMTFKKSYLGPITGQARTTLRDIAGEYLAVEFFYNRSLIGDNMWLALEEAVQPYYVDVVFFQLREIDLPDQFEDALRNVQIARQEFEIAQYEQQAALVRAQTEIYLAEADATMKIITAEADAEAFLIDINAKAEAINITLTAQKEALYGLAQGLGLNSTELLAYLWIQAILEHDSSWLIVGSNTPDLILNTGG